MAKLKLYKFRIVSSEYVLAMSERKARRTLESYAELKDNARVSGVEEVTSKRQVGACDVWLAWADADLLPAPTSVPYLEMETTITRDDDLGAVIEKLQLAKKKSKKKAKG
jgi:hypothetical protein